MPLRRFAAQRRLALALLTCVGLAACENIESTLQPIPAPALTTITVSLSPTSITTGQTSTATASGLDQINSGIGIAGVAWTTGNVAIATVDATTGVITGRAGGTTTVVASSGGKTAQATITVTAPPAIRINEVESNGGTPGDWIELFNPTTAAVSVAGWALRDEGFAFTSNAECVSGRKPVFWADDSETGGRSIRQASITCGTVAPSMPAMRAGDGSANPDP